MTAEATESSFSPALIARLSKKSEQAGKAVEKRIKAERRADMTEKEIGRRRQGPPKVQLNMRVTAETDALAKELATHLGKSIPEMITLAVAAFAASTPTFRRKEAQQS